MAKYHGLTVTVIAVTVVPYTVVMWLILWFGTVPVGTVWSTGVVLMGMGAVYAKPTHGCHPL